MSGFTDLTFVLLVLGTLFFSILTWAVPLGL